MPDRCRPWAVQPQAMTQHRLGEAPHVGPPHGGLNVLARRASARVIETRLMPARGPAPYQIG